MFLLTLSYILLSWSWQNPGEICMGLKFLFTVAPCKKIYFILLKIFIAKDSHYYYMK